MDDELEIKAYYAGHVLGAAMFQIKVGSESVVYTVSGSPWGTGATAWLGRGATRFTATFFARAIII